MFSPITFLSLRRYSGLGFRIARYPGGAAIHLSQTIVYLGSSKPLTPFNISCTSARHDRRNMTKEFLIGFTVGAGLGVLIAPRSGQDTRSKLKARAEQLFGQSGAQPPSAESLGATEASKAAPGSGRVSAERGEDQSVAEVLNHARKAELTSVKGIGDVTAKRIIKNRPYTSPEEAVREEVIPEETLEKVKEQLVERKADEEGAA